MRIIKLFEAIRAFQNWEERYRERKKERKRERERSSKIKRRNVKGE